MFQRGGINTDAARKSGLMRCPPDYHELGRHTWTYLHSLAMYYPEEPTEALKEDMETHLDTFSRLYPCSPCAVHMREYTKENPFELDSRLKFSLWMCNFHNDVNRLQRKPLFDCRRLVDRWGLPPPKQCLLERQAAYDLFVDHDDEELDADLGDFVDDEDEVDDDDELYA